MVTVLSHQQALRRGVTARRVRTEVSRGTWQRLYPGVFVTHGGPVSYRERLLAATLARGPGARVSLECALHLWGLTDREPSIITLVEPVDTHRVSRLPGVRVVRRGRISAGKRHDIPVTGLAQTILDLAALPHRPITETLALVTTAMRKHKLSLGELQEELTHHPRHPRRHELMAILAAAEDGLESVAEARYAAAVEEPHGLPRLERQYPIDGPAAVRDGRSRRQDFRDPATGVGLEIDGELYHRDRQHQDRARDREAAGRGEVILRAGWVDVVSTPCQLAAHLAAALLARGWTGLPTPCSPGCAVGRDARLRRSS